eukprot:TRINITY_DN8668_c0_g1_i2.p1 TRINITY_DN8668_c0_g1~~TRINITY_DN8668_c0_g1_i2.p1  ORF type:complete len:284 (+),score=10.42 TRINITY_DN8668_c0_g1_i2:399-1250(+)
MINQDTICAVATAQGGAIGIIRVSGPDAIDITSSIFVPIQERTKLQGKEAYTLTFGRICKGEEVIDEVLVSLFRTPHSYTGENSTEISCHGSSYILQQIMQLLIEKGCRSALPGEFTQRAFLNGKMDLSQAEAVADLISSSSAATHRLAMSQMRGGFSKELTDLRTQLLNFVSMVELELDFSEEEVEFANRDALLKLTENIEYVIARLADSFNVGNAIKNGIPFANQKTFYSRFFLMSYGNTLNEIHWIFLKRNSSDKSHNKIIHIETKLLSYIFKRVVRIES